jgi:hypothetical protein
MLDHLLAIHALGILIILMVGFEIGRQWGKRS